MPRRHNERGATVESDSFLDIVANIVGILIILIVVAGVRVGQSVALEPAPQPVAQGPVPPEVQPVVAPRPVIVHVPVSEAPAAPEPSLQLLAEIDATLRETERLRAERSSLLKRSQSLDVELAAATADAERLKTERATVLQQLSAFDESSRALTAELDEIDARFKELNRQASELPQKKVTVLQHQLNPIGREVRDEELHFRLLGGHVARVPIEELVARLKPEIERQKEWIIKYQRQQGRVGPIDGFSMDYVVERQRLSVVEELRLGAQVMRIIVSGWKLVPEPNLPAESVDEALRSDSRFMSALRLAPRSATVTFWVYPDSFEAYRRLQQAVYEAGLDVAARPLPYGVPIAGSPNGSRSSSQ